MKLCIFRFEYSTCASDCYFKLVFLKNFAVLDAPSSVRQTKDIPMALDPILLDLADLSSRTTAVKPPKLVRLESDGKKLRERKEPFSKSGCNVRDTKSNEVNTAKVVAEKKELNKKPSAKGCVEVEKVAKAAEKIQGEETGGVKKKVMKETDIDSSDIKQTTTHPKSCSTDGQTNKDQSKKDLTNGSSVKEQRAVNNVKESERGNKGKADAADVKTDGVEVGLKMKVKEEANIETVKEVAVAGSALEVEKEPIPEVEKESTVEVEKKPAVELEKSMLFYLSVLRVFVLSADRPTLSILLSLFP